MGALGLHCRNVNRLQWQVPITFDTLVGVSLCHWQSTIAAKI